LRTKRGGQVILERSLAAQESGRVAIPTAIEGALQHALCVRKSVQGVPFDAVDRQPVHIFFLLLARGDNRPPPEDVVEDFRY